MAAEIILPATTYEGIIEKGTNGNQIGDILIPNCDSRNLSFKAGSTFNYKWTVISELGVGSTIYPGKEWKVTFEVFHDQLSAAGIAIPNDGINPLRLILQPQGPVLKGANPVGEIPRPTARGSGDRPWGNIGPYGSWGYSFDENSDPKLLKADVGDGVSARITVTLKATGPGVIELPLAELEGYDGSPIAGPLSCDPMVINMSWNVVQPAEVIAKNDIAYVDARYTNVDPQDANSGTHIIKMEVLANDEDPNLPGPPGDLSEVKVQDWDTVTTQGGQVSCGTPAQKNPPLSDPLASASIGICVYQPPMNFVGTDSFSYVTRGQANGGDAATATANVTIHVLPNARPLVTPPSTGTASGQDIVIDLNPYIVDPDGDNYTCLPNGAAAPGVGTASVFTNCTIDWDNTSPGFVGNVTIPFRVCDQHATLDVPDLGNNVIRGEGYEAGDLNNNLSRRCRTAVATIGILQGLRLPPIGVSDNDVVDAGYAADGVGAYSVSIPVLDNDTDGNGPNPSMPSAALAVLIPPAVNEGTAVIVGDELVFTPADGFSGAVSMTYRVCEDPAVQNPAYFDDPNTPLIDEGLPICGVGTVSIIVLGNAAPIVNPDATTIADDALLSGFDLGINDSDPDGDPISCTAGVPVASNPALVDTASISANCMLSFNPVDGQAGVVEFTYEVCDQHTLANPTYPANPYGADGLSPGEISSRCSTGIATITVTVIPDPEPNPGDLDPDPVCVADVAITGIGVPVVISVLANDSDFDADLLPAPVILTGPTDDDPETTPEGGNAVMNSATTIIYTPPQNFQGVDTFSYTGRDELGQACKAGVTVTVNGLGGGGSAIAIPTLSRWAELLMILLVALAGVSAFSISRR